MIWNANPSGRHCVGVCSTPNNPVKKRFRTIWCETSFYACALFYQMTTRLEGARYMPSVFFTPKAAYHSGKFRGGILARR